MTKQINISIFYSSCELFFKKYFILFALNSHFLITFLLRFCKNKRTIQQKLIALFTQNHPNPSFISHDE